MAAIPAASATVLFTEGGGERATLYRIKGVNTGDTFDFSEAVTSGGGTSQFNVVTSAVWAPSGNNSSGGVVGAIGSNTIVTFTLAAMALQTIYVLVRGESAV